MEIINPQMLVEDAVVIPPLCNDGIMCRNM